MADDGRESREGYYEEVADAVDLARASGWRRSIGQRARFEMALAPWSFEAVDSLLDVGCGPGALRGYLEATGREVEYTGLEIRESAVQRARDRHPEARFHHGDVFELESRDAFDLVVSVGGHIDGRPPDGPGDRRSRIGRLLTRAARLARVGFSCVVLDERALRERASLRLEPALFGAYRAECERWMEELATSGWIVDDALSTDLAVAGAPNASTSEPRAVEGIEILESVADDHLHQRDDRLEVAWLWLEARRTERAEAVLESVEGEGERYRHLLERLRMQKATET